MSTKSSASLSKGRVSKGRCKPALYYITLRFMLTSEKLKMGMFEMNKVTVEFLR
jgi:hypothetical protein